jgi:hypothetical protein
MAIANVFKKADNPLDNKGSGVWGLPPDQDRTAQHDIDRKQTRVATNQGTGSGVSPDKQPFRPYRIGGLGVSPRLTLNPRSDLFRRDASDSPQ